LNVHPTLEDPVQRLFIALEPGTYIRPHRHPEPDKWELFVLINGAVDALLLDDDGKLAVMPTVVECLDQLAPSLRAAYPHRDWILTRILWLSGCEPGINRLGEVDTMRRYIYIHGSPDSAEMGKPGSIGCIRMRNADIVELFDLVPAGVSVEIRP
jgi:hypothetical protein